MTHKGTERFGLLSLHLLFTERDLVEEVLHLLCFFAKKYCDNRLAQIEHLHELDLDESRLSFLPSTLDQLASGDVHVQVRAGGRSLEDYLEVLVLCGVFLLLLLFNEDFFESFTLVVGECFGTRLLNVVLILDLADVEGPENSRLEVDQLLLLIQSQLKTAVRLHIELLLGGLVSEVDLIALVVQNYDALF